MSTEGVDARFGAIFFVGGVGAVDDPVAPIAQHDAFATEFRLGAVKTSCPGGDRVEGVVVVVIVFIVFIVVVVVVVVVAGVAALLAAM